jgi:hypothetical protein
LEDIIFNLVNNIDLDVTKRKITEYKQNNQQQIAMNFIKEAIHINPQQNIVENSMKLKDSTVPSKQVDGKQDNVKKQPTVIQNQTRQMKSLTPEEQEKLLQTRSKAGGYSIEFPMKRAYAEAFATLVPKNL